MRAHNKPFRFAAWIAVAGMVLGPAAPAARAQTPPPPDQAQGPEITPPLRVGRLGWIQGSVSFHTADQDDWSPAVVNYPVTTGDGFWTQPGAEAGIQVSDVLVAMSPTTELDINNLDETSFAATEPQGEIYLRVGTLTPGETYSIQTPRGMVTIATSGRYEIAAGTTQTPTLVTVLEGAAQISGAQPINVAAGNTAEITGDQVFQSQLVPAMHDAFLNAMLAREQQRPAVAAAPPPLVAQMPGGEELSEYGSWSQAPDYGQVWYPQVQAGWEPYREGHWAYVAPWGWTWVDDDPWGFAPFHYGRWVEIGGRWAWVPGAEMVAAAPPQPVYAPALVAFFGVGAALAAGAAFGGSVGWCPLGPGEAWHPWFRASPAYFRDVNIRHVTNINNVNITNVTINQFRNARAATVVPASAMLTSAQVRPLARSVPPAQLAQVRPVVGRVPVQPTTATLGVTPAVARQFHIGAPPAGIAAPARPTAPGPQIRRPAAFAAPGQRPAAPALRTPAEATRASAGPGSVPPATGAIRPPGGAREVPALRPPGAGTAGPPPIVHEPGRAAVTGAPGEARPGAVALPPESRAGLPGRAPETVQHGLVAGAPAAHPVEPGARTAPETRAPIPMAHEAPRSAPESRAAVPHPAPEIHAAVPRPPVETHVAPPAPHPAPEVHAAPTRPPVEAHVAAPAPRPAPEVHAAPPRPPVEAHVAAPAPHPAPEAHAAPQQHAEHQERRPGQP